MRDLLVSEAYNVNGAGINLGNLIIGATFGAFGGFLRGAPMGPAAMIGGALFFGALGAASAATADAYKIKQELENKPLYT